MSKPGGKIFLKKYSLPKTPQNFISFVTPLLRNIVVLLAVFVFAGFVVVAGAHAQVVINEFSSGDSSDWVEIINIATSSADLSLYQIKDSGTNSKNLSGLLEAGGILSFSFANYLNNSGDVVKLIKISNNEVLDEIGYGGDSDLCAPQAGQSIGRKPDGTGGFARFSSSTRDLSNTSEILSCPTPTPTATPTEAPVEQTATPTPTTTTTSTPTSTKTPTPKPTVKPTLTPSSTAGAETEVLGLRQELLTLDPSPSPEGFETTKKVSPLSVIFLMSGGLVIGLAGFSFLKSRGKEYNDKDETKQQPPEEDILA